MGVKSKKAHGKISFAELARKISYEWKHITPDRKAHYAQLANQDKVRYMHEMEEWRREQDAKRQDNQVFRNTATVVHPETSHTSQAQDSDHITLCTPSQLAHRDTAPDSLVSYRFLPTEALFTQIEPALFEYGRPSNFQIRHNHEGFYDSILTNDISLARLDRSLDMESKSILIAAFSKL